MQHPETARLTLRPFSPGDFDDLCACQSRPDVARYLRWNARDRAQVREALATQCGETDLRAPGDWLTFAVVWREAEVVGGQWADELVYAVLEHEWRAGPTRSSRW